MIVMLTALAVEQDAVLEHLVGEREHRHAQGSLFDVGTLAGHPGREVAVGVTGQGALAAATLTERAIAEFSPSAVLFVGVAGGLRDWLEIGDVVVGTKVYAYHGGKSTDSAFLARPKAWEIAHELDQVARRVQRARTWHRSSREGQAPEVYFEAIAAGDVVLDSKTSAVADALHHNYNDAVAVEMESAGFAAAGHLAGRTATATVRGISDHADGSKSVTDRRGGQRLAARSAAAFAVALAAAAHDSSAPGAKPLPQVSIGNFAQTARTVGQQNNVNTGDFHMNLGEKW
jgi:adenosylhomocysteine nucleosidase